VVIPRSPAWILGAVLLTTPGFARAQQELAPFRIGAARVDVTPEMPIRLSGYAARGTQAETVVQRLYARALAVDDGVNGPAVLVSVDNAAVPAWLIEMTAARLARAIGLPRTRLVIASTHTHTGPLLQDSIPNMFGADVPAEHRERVDRYSAWLGERMAEAAHAAVVNLQPGRLATGRGSLPMAANRRTAGGPVDHDLPFLAATNADGALIALVANYACHCTTLGGNDNFICGDWAGYAAEFLERDRAGAVALITIGCGADANPTGFGLAFAQQNGRAIADEVVRLLGSGTQPLAGPLTARLATIRLPFDRLPTQEEWQARLAQGGAVAYHAQKNLDRLARGEALPTELDYPVATWTFGDGLALVFLGGEVVVDYALRLKREFDAARIWVTAYANDVPCYIPSERILKEGGYEAEGAMIYYDRPTRLATGVEQRIVDAVRAQIPAEFRKVMGVDVGRTEGVPPKTPQQAREALRAHDGLRVELVAAEPLVASPVALDFGPDGSLWVCEMRDYPLGMDGAGAPGGRIVVLRDTDGDGLPDTRTIFLDGIPFPTGVTVWRDGALVCASNDILYAADRNGDGRADEVRALYSGFRTDNFQARVNSLELGLDGWIYGASGQPVGTVTSFSGASVELGGRDFRIRPETGEIEPVTGITQQGRCRDDFGNAFGCDNGTILRHYPLEERYLRRNPHVVPPLTSVLVPRDPDANRVFPRSRILARFNEPDAAGRVTSGCGVGLYRDVLLGEEFAGNSFTCEPVHNLVTRLVLRPDGATFAGARAPEETASEFLASTDPWFRPVQARTGPDGALYVVDMARFVIEHPTWIPEERLAQLDVRAGAELGRIWRVVPADRPRRPAPRFDRMDENRLAAELSTPNGPARDLIQAQLTQRAGPAPVAILRALVHGNAHAGAIAQALSILALLGELRPDDVRAALLHPHPGVRRVAARLAEPWLDADLALFQAVAALAGDPSGQVRAQVACSLGEARRPEAGAAISQALATRDPDPHVRAAWLSSALPHLSAILSTADSDSQDEWIALAVQSDDGAALRNALSRIREAVQDGRWDEAIHLGAVLLEAEDRRGAGASRLPAISARARGVAGDAGAETWLRLRALVLLGRDATRLADDVRALGALLGGSEMIEMQRAAIETLARIPDPRAAQALIGAWDRIGPALRSAALDALLAREASIALLLDTIAERKDLAAVLDISRRALLLEHAQPEIRARASGLLGVQVNRDLDAIVARYAQVRELRGNPMHGASLFAQNCGLCHSLDGVGTPIGPDLGALSDRSAQALLLAILDPNRAINPEYANYLVRTRDGRYLTGIVRDESAGSLRLISLGGSEVELLRSNVLEIRDLRASMMPAGFESVLSVADMADLIAYLQAADEPPKAFAGNRPALVTADADGSLTFSAATARIHGDTLIFEAPFQNLGYWSSAGDRAVWEVRTERAGEWDVMLDYACDDAVAGNTLVVESASGRLAHRVAGTGGWSTYRTGTLGRLALPAGHSRVTARSEGAIRGALLDLRALRLRAAGADPPPPESPLHHLLEGLQPGTPREHERIPAIWQIAIAAGHANQTAELRALLDLALPREGEPLAHWQAVVVGGGLVNGLSQVGVGPRERLREVIGGDTALALRLARAIELAAEMAHDESRPAGARYDALRILGISTWEVHGADLVRYLAPGTDPEPQMGAVAGLGDIADPRAWDALRAALDGLTSENRALAEAALRRVPSLQQCLDSGFDLWGEFALRLPEGPTYDFFADLLPPLRYVNTNFRHYPIVLSAPGSAVKARFVSDGSGVNLHAGTTTWRDEALAPVRFFLGDRDGSFEPYGADLARLDGPRLAEGWMPIVQLAYEHAGIRIQQEAFVTLDSEDAVLCIRFTASAEARVIARIGGTQPLRNRGEFLLQEDGRILARCNDSFDFDREERALAGTAEHGRPADLFLFTHGTRDQPGLSYETERKRCAEHWSRVVAGAASVETGEERVDAAYRALIVGTLLLAQGDVLNYSAGNLYETTFEAECGDAARALMACGVPEAQRFVAPLLARPLQDGIPCSDVAYKLQLLAWTHFFRRDAVWTRAQLSLVLPEAERALGWIEAETGLVPAQAYCGDIQTPCHNLYANAAFWRGLRDLALVLRDLGGAEETQAARFEAAAATLRARVVEAVAASERTDVDPPFVPIALFGVEQPYRLLTETMQGSYWNLIAPYVHDSGIFGPDSPRTAAMVDWQLRRGGLCMGLLRFHQHSGLFANEDALDDLYTLRLAEELLRRDEADSALVSFYGKLAQGMTRDTFIGCEGSGLRPLDEHGRAMYLPPNAAANAFFLLTLRHLLVQDFDLDCDGRADALCLLYATPRAWLEDGGRIAVARMPTFFGPVSLEVRSELARGRVRGFVELPPGLTAPASLKLRLPAGTARADGGSEILELAPGGGRREFEIAVRPTAK